MTSKIPKKLGKEPLLDAIFEMRFLTEVPLASVLPGILVGLGSVTGFERLSPAADLPKPIRDAEPSLRFAPMIRMRWHSFQFLLSDQSIAVACSLPSYPGWEVFKDAILTVFNHICKQAPFIDKVERYSLKYTNLIEAANSRDRASLVNLHLVLGDHILEQEAFHVRIEIPQNDFLSAVQIVSSVNVTMLDGSIREGLILDIDTIRNTGGKTPSEVLVDFTEKLDEIHHANKKWFFDCLATPWSLTMNKYNQGRGFSEAHLFFAVANDRIPRYGHDEVRPADSGSVVGLKNGSSARLFEMDHLHPVTGNYSIAPVLEETGSATLEEALTKLYKRLLESQEPLGYEFEKVLYDNLWDLQEKC